MYFIFISAHSCVVIRFIWLDFLSVFSIKCHYLSSMRTERTKKNKLHRYQCYNVEKNCIIFFLASTFLWRWDDTLHGTSTMIKKCNWILAKNQFLFQKRKNSGEINNSFLLFKLKNTRTEVSIDDKLEQNNIKCG